MTDFIAYMQINSLKWQKRKGAGLILVNN